MLLIQRDPRENDPIFYGGKKHSAKTGGDIVTVGGILPGFMTVDIITPAVAFG